MSESSSTSGFFLFSWFKTFKHVLIGSITDLHYYVEVLNTPFKFTFKMVAWFYLVLGVCLTLGFTLKELPEISKRIDAARAELVERYPQDLVFDWDGQTLNSTAQDKIFIPYPQASPVVSENAPQYLAEINTLTTEAPDNVSAVVYVNQTHMYVNSFQGTWSDSTLLHLIGPDPQKIGREQILKFAESSKSVQQDLQMSLPWLALLYFTLGVFLLRLFMIAFNAIIVQFVFQLMNKPLSYKKVFQLSMHILIPVELIHQISFLVAPKLEFPMFSAAYWMIVALLTWHLRHLKVLQLEIKKEEK